MFKDTKQGPRGGGTTVDRRAVLKSMLAGSALLLPGAEALAQGAPVTFTHNVASGDPLSDRVVLWTRAVPNVTGDTHVTYAISTRPDMSNVVKGGLAQAAVARDYTVKVDVGGLQPNTTYYYQFAYRGIKSPIGRTRTLPVGRVDALRFAIFSCSNYTKGFFNVYRDAVKLTDLNAVIHLGDYIYEYGPGGYHTPLLDAGIIHEVRGTSPSREILALIDYRARYAEYRSDADLQELHRLNPWITVWDDHEFANDTWSGGAQNHQANEGSWDARRTAARQAYFDWMPIREPIGQVYRSFDFGDIARLIMLDTRAAGRDLQIEDPAALVGVYQSLRADGSYALDRNSAGVARSLLGLEQENWVAEQLRGSNGQVWQILGNQTLFEYQPMPDFLNSTRLTAQEKQAAVAGIDQIFGPGAGQQLSQIGALGGPNPTASDSWTGYPTARARMIQLLAQAANPVMITGDSHNAWAASLRAPVGGRPLPIGVEFAGPSVTSPGFEETLPVLPPEKLAGLLVDSTARNPLLDQLLYSDTARRGYMVMDVTRSRVTTDYIFASTVFSPTASFTTARRLQTLVGSKSLSEVPA